ncbi:right-handed parallel beta-helix repeat-containing protein [Pontiellaceae bacterium B1224]|nr:right-handed parallel beta-helix repeat-containing protein [Pontiellaceae bacterium B1224]
MWNKKSKFFGPCSNVWKRVGKSAAVVGALLFGLNVFALDYYVATTGNDSHAGSMNAPFQTLEKAQLAVRAALPSAIDPIHVWVRGGTYYLGSALEFGTTDSGSASVPVTYSGYSNETVIISGAIPLSPTWTTHSGNIQVATVGSGLDFDMLFINNDLQVMARYPNYDEDTAILNGYASDAIGSTKVNSWSDPAGGFYRGLHGSRWGGNSYRITGKSGSSLNLDWVGDNNRGSGVHSTYRMVENIFEELDAEGEWFYDESDGKLYFYPPNGVDLSTAIVEAASLEELIRVVGTAETKVKYLTFRNFAFTGTHRTLFTREYEPMNRSDWRLARAGAIFIQDAENVTVSDSVFDRIGGNGVFFSAYNRNHLVTNNEFLDNGATCVNVCGSKVALWDTNEWDDYITDAADIDINTEIGPKTEDYPKDITISYNHMFNMGRFEKQTAGVNLFLAESITVSHNTIHSSPRSGINICDGAWGGHIIEFNDVFDCIRETNDHGPFNSWGRDRFYSIGGYNHNGGDGAIKRPYAFLEAWKTTHIRNNRFHYDEPTEFGIDLDDGSSNYEIYNNLILNTSVKLREGFSRKVYNNIMINRGLDLHVWYDTCRDELFNNIIVNPSAYHPISVGGAGEEATTDYNLFF